MEFLQGLRDLASDVISDVQDVIELPVVGFGQAAYLSSARISLFSHPQHWAGRAHASNHT
jgi:hypothetical protein